MAAAGGSTGAKSDKKWHGSLMHKISKMLTENDFKKLKHLFYITDQVARTDIDKSDDVFLFLALLERRDHISVGRYDVLIDHLETLELNDCVRVIREHTEEIMNCRQTQARGGATSGTDEELLESRQLRMVERLVDKKLQDEKLSKQMIEDLINKKLHGQLSKQTVEDLVNKKFQEFQASENQVHGHAEGTLLSHQSARSVPGDGKKGKTREAKPRELPKTTVRCVAPRSADFNKYDKNGLTPLMLAAENNDVARVRSFIEAGADLDMKTAIFKRTALMIASVEGHTEVVADLIKAGANVDIQDKAGYTALIAAARYGHKEIVAKLIESGADVNNREQWSRKTALGWAINNGDREVAEMLKRAGASE